MAGARYGSRCGAGVGGRGVVAGRARAERDACGPTGDVKNPGTHRGWRSAEGTVAHRRERSLPSAVRRRPRGTAWTVRWMTPRTTASSTTGVLGAGAAAAIDHRPGISPSRPAPVQNSRDTPRYHNVLCLPRAPQLLPLCQRDLVGGSNTRLPYSGSVAPCTRIPGRGTSGKSRGAPKAAWPRCPHRLGNLRVALAAVRPHLESYLQWVAMPTKHVKWKVGQAPCGKAGAKQPSQPSQPLVRGNDRPARAKTAATDARMPPGLQDSRRLSERGWSSAQWSNLVYVRQIAHTRTSLRKLQF